jgi:hypothetical protein
MKPTCLLLWLYTAQLALYYGCTQPSLPSPLAMHSPASPFFLLYMQPSQPFLLATNAAKHAPLVIHAAQPALYIVSLFIDDVENVNQHIFQHWKIVVF